MVKNIMSDVAFNFERFFLVQISTDGFPKFVIYVGFMNEIYAFFADFGVF